MNIYSSASLSASLFCLILGGFILIKRKNDKKCKLFSIATIFTGLWATFPFVLSRAPDKDSALFFARIVYIFAFLTPPAWLHFMLTLVKDKWLFKEKAILILSYTSCIPFLLFLFNPLFIKGTNRAAPHFSVIPGPLFIFFVILFTMIFIYVIKTAFHTFKTTSGYKKNQLKFILLSFIFGFLSGAFHFGAAYFHNELFPHDFLLVTYIGLIAYAIIKYRLMDITLTITRTGVFIAVYTLVFGLPYLLAIWGKAYLSTLLGNNWWLGPLVLMSVLGTVGPFIYIFLEKRAEYIILRDQRRYQETLKLAAREIARIRNPKKLFNLIVHIVNKTVGITHSAIYLFEAKAKEFSLKAKRGLISRQSVSMNNENALISWLEAHKEPLLYEEIKRKAEENANSIFKELEERMRLLNAAVIVPGFLEGKLFGFLTLGDKRSGKMYTSEDLNSFSVLASQSVLAIENALLYENIEEQVRLRTNELIEVQKQLVQAEKLATVGTLAGGVAHEINNPLTAILTNVQMMLMDDSNDALLDRESLALIEEATKRCREIVKKLMVYARKPLEPSKVSNVNFLKAIENVISFLHYQLEQENVKIIFAAKKENRYLVNADCNELEQVVTNLILNAKDAIRKIKKSGSVYIRLFKTNGAMSLEVKDEGAGIPQEILSKIFDPFFTTKDVGQGLGLGLSISQAIVEKYNGVISVQSALGKGSVFTVRFPSIGPDA